jgi:oligosaccharide repeat unit polymerase
MILAIILFGYLVLTCRRPLITSIPRLVALEWIILISAYLVYQSEFVPLKSAFLIYSSVFFVCFFLAYEVGIRIRLAPIRPPVAVPPAYVFVVAMVAGAVSIGLGIFHATSTGIVSAIEYRELFSPEVGSTPLSNRIGISFPLVCAAWLLARLQGRPGLSMVFGAVAVTLAVLSTSKIFLVLCVLYAFSEQNSPWRLRRVFLLIAVGLGLFAGLHIMLEKVVGDLEGDALSSLVKTLRVYLLGGIAGFQQFVETDSFFPRNALWKPLGDLIAESISVPSTPILPWSQIGEWYGNVYTAFAYWVEAFGWGSCIGVGVVLGTLYGLIQNAPATPSGTYFRVFSIFPLLFIFHQDFYLASLHVWVAFIAASIVLWTTRLPLRGPEHG